MYAFKQKYCHKRYVPRSMGNSVYLQHMTIKSSSDDMAASLGLCSYLLFMVFRAACFLSPNNALLFNKVLSCLTLPKKTMAYIK